MTVNEPEIVVSYSGELLAFAGTPENFHLKAVNPELVKQAKYYMAQPTSINIVKTNPKSVTWTGNDTLLAITAAMVAVNPGHAIIVEAPQDIKELINTWTEEVQVENNPNTVY